MLDASDGRRPIWAPEPGPAAPRNMCTDCGLSRTARANDCGRACQFIKPDYPGSRRRSTAAPATRPAPRNASSAPTARCTARR
jgi:coenzyme F420 hydrogenase subunit beta